MDNCTCIIATPKEFNKYLTKSKRLELLTVYREEVLARWQLFLFPKYGGAGFAITPDKELVNHFNNTAIKGLGKVLVRYAIILGVTKLFCFDGFLRKYYKSCGFEVTDVGDWNDEPAPVNWNYEKYGKPGMVWMLLKQ